MTKIVLKSVCGSLYHSCIRKLGPQHLHLFRLLPFFIHVETVTHFFSEGVGVGFQRWQSTEFKNSGHGFLGLKGLSG